MPQTIDWLPAYETGNPKVDEEHKALCNLVNLIILASNYGESRECARAVKDGIAALHRYVDTHFANEERLLRAQNSRHLVGQVAEHNTLRAELHNLWSVDDDTPSERVIGELALWAKNRLLRHFVSYDCSTFETRPGVETYAESPA